MSHSPSTISVVIIAIVACLGCRTQDTSNSNRFNAVEDAVPSMSGTKPQEEVATNSPDEVRALEAAKMYLANESSKPIRATYEVRPTEEGYSIFVQYEPAFPGGHCVILVSPDFKVTKVVGGA